MAERGVTEAQILYVLANYHLSAPGLSGSCCYIGTIEGAELKVWLLSPMTGEEGPESKVIVKSVAWRDRDDDQTQR